MCVCVCVFRNIHAWQLLISRIIKRTRCNGAVVRTLIHTLAHTHIQIGKETEELSFKFMPPVHNRHKRTQMVGDVEGH